MNKTCRKWMNGVWCRVKCVLSLGHEGNHDFRPLVQKKTLDKLGKL